MSKIIWLILLIIQFIIIHNNINSMDSDIEDIYVDGILRGMFVSICIIGLLKCFI